MEAATRQGRLPTGDLTMLFSDIEGSTRLLHDIGEAYGDVLADHHRVLRGIWAGHDGIEVHADGDAFLVVFLEPRRAVAAAAAAQEALAAHAWPHGRDLRVRMGIHTGSAQVRHEDYWGIDVHYAARLCTAAHGGQVLLSAATRAVAPDASVTDLGEHALKDFPAARRIFHLELPGRDSSDFPPPRTLEVVRSNLPSITTRLIGRNAELDAVRERFKSGERLVTLTGIGGSGKTALALACGGELIDAFGDGVFLVSLASIADRERAGFAIGQAVGAPIEDGRDPLPVVAGYLARRDLLLILDNMEHLLDAAPALADLLDQAPGLRMLVTSQTPLRVRGEAAVPVGPLDVPAAVALFTERARAADPGFSLAPDEVAVAAELCRRLDGLPLAVELAAARVRLMRPRQLVAALEQGIDLLGGGARDLPERQRGLRAALDWTVSLLGEQERTLFAAAGAFAEAWTIEQLDRMYGEELDVFEALASLLDFSLVQTRGDGRFTMAERVRRYAQALLDGDEHGDDFRRRHALMLAESAELIHDEILLDVSAQAARTADLMPELTGALAWTSSHDSALHRRLVAALGLPYYLAGRLSTLGPDIHALAVASGPEDEIAARLLVSHSMVLTSRGDNSGGADAAVRGASVRRKLDDERGEAVSLCVAAHLLSFVDDTRAAEILERVRGLDAVRGDRRLGHLLEGEVALHLFALGELDEAEAIFTEAVADDTRTDYGVDFAPSYLADAALARERYDVALIRYGDALRALRGMQLHNVLLQCYGIAAALAGLGQDGAAIELMAAIGSLGRRDGIEIPEDLFPPAARLLAAARERLGEAAVGAAGRRGRGRELDDAVAWALSLASQIAVGQ